MAHKVVIVCSIVLFVKRFVRNLVLNKQFGMVTYEKNQTNYSVIKINHDFINHVLLGTIIKF